MAAVSHGVVVYKERTPRRETAEAKAVAVMVLRAKILVGNLLVKRWQTERRDTA